MVSHWSLSESKSPQISRTLCILADRNNAVVWMISTRHLISKSSSPFMNPLGFVPSTLITIGIIVTFMLLLFFFFFSSLAKPERDFIFYIALNCLGKVQIQFFFQLFADCLLQPLCSNQSKKRKL